MNFTPSDNPSPEFTFEGEDVEWTVNKQPGKMIFDITPNKNRYNFTITSGDKTFYQKGWTWLGKRKVKTEWR